MATLIVIGDVRANVWSGRRATARLGGGGAVWPDGKKCSQPLVPATDLEADLTRRGPRQQAPQDHTHTRGLQVLPFRLASSRMILI